MSSFQHCIDLTLYPCFVLWSSISKTSASAAGGNEKKKTPTAMTTDTNSEETTMLLAATDSSRMRMAARDPILDKTPHLRTEKMRERVGGDLGKQL